MVAALLLVLSAGPAVEDPLELRYGVSTEVIDGELWCSVAAEDAPLGPLLEALSERAGVTFQGVERLPSDLRVSAYLERRPLSQAVTWILGSAGLRADRRLDTFTLRADARERTDLLTEGQAAYLRALREWPNHEGAPRAVFGQALLEEDRGNSGAARAHYERLIEGWPSSDLVPEALRSCAELWQADREWSHAAQKWSDLLRLEREHEYETLAYTELARCTALLGDSERALFMLDALENLAPAEGEEDAQDRLYIRARALVGARRFHHALDALDEADLTERTAIEELDSFEIRALALEGIGRDADASRAWLAFAQRAIGSDREEGLRRAAELALGAGDELSVLFIEQLATKLGEDGVVEASAREARQRLDLEDTDLVGASALERLDRAERLLAGGLGDEAHDLLESIRAQSTRFSEVDATRFLLAFGRTLGERAGVDAALEMLREGIGSIQDAERRRSIYLLAAELLEAEERFDDAIEAYKGRL
jgi:tetratricopeptide (TPR) repeat protein